MAWDLGSWPFGPKSLKIGDRRPCGYLPVGPHAQGI